MIIVQKASLLFKMLMVLLHIRSWQQGVIMGVIMSVALLFPYILISNTINISNKIEKSYDITPNERAGYAFELLENNPTSIFTVENNYNNI